MNTKKNIFVRVIDYIFDLKEKRKPVKIERKKYLLFALFMGWCGAHKFLSKQYIVGVIYLALFWTGIPIAMTLIDLMIALPILPDEEGYIML